MKYPNIAAERIRRGLSQDELAQEMHITPKTVYGWEALGDIPASSVGKLADFFGVSADYLLGRTAPAAEMPDSIDADFAMVCKGDGMRSARIYDGDLIMLRKTPDFSDGDIIAVTIDGAATLMRVSILPWGEKCNGCDGCAGCMVLTCDGNERGIRLSPEELSRRFVGKPVAFLASLNDGRARKAV